MDLVITRAIPKVRNKEILSDLLALRKFGSQRYAVLVHDGKIVAKLPKKAKIGFCKFLMERSDYLNVYDKGRFGIMPSRSKGCDCVCVKFVTKGSNSEYPKLTRLGTFWGFYDDIEGRLSNSDFRFNGDEIYKLCRITNS